MNASSLYTLRESGLSAVSLTWALLLIAAIVLVGVAASWFRGSRLPPLERREVFTKAESRFFELLQHAFPQQRILSQLSMGALLKPRRGLDKGEWWRAYNGIAQKRVDFVLCTPRGEVLCLIELDDASHDAQADAYRDRVLGLGRYVVVRFRNKPWPTIGIVRQAVFEAIGLEAGGTRRAA
jgi:hypothetical protein